MKINSNTPLLLLSALLLGCATAEPIKDQAGTLLAGQFISVELLSAVEKSRELPIAQALIAERPGRIHLSYLAQVDAQYGDDWVGASGSRVAIAWGRVQRVRYLQSELLGAEPVVDPVADWLAGQSGWPAVGAVSERSLLLSGRLAPLREIRRVSSLELLPAVVQAGAYTALRIVEEIEYPGTPFSRRAELWVDPFTRELLWLRGPVSPEGPELLFELVVPVQRQLPGS